MAERKVKDTLRECGREGSSRGDREEGTGEERRKDGHRKINGDGGSRGEREG